MFILGRGRDRRRHRIASRLQALRCQHRGQHGARTHEQRDHGLSRSQPLNRLSHPGAPLGGFPKPGSSPAVPARGPPASPGGYGWGPGTQAATLGGRGLPLGPGTGSPLRKSPGSSPHPQGCRERLLATVSLGGHVSVAPWRKAPWTHPGTGRSRESLASSTTFKEAPDSPVTAIENVLMRTVRDQN